MDAQPLSIPDKPKAPVTRLAYPIYEYCQLTGISRTEVYELMNLGLIRFVFIGTDRRIPHSELIRTVEHGIPIPPEIQSERTAKNRAYRKELDARKAAGEPLKKRGRKAKSDLV